MEEHQNLQNKVNELEEKLILVKMSKNSLDQCNWQNNAEIQGILASVSGDSLEDKIIDFLSWQTSID